MKFETFEWDEDKRSSNMEKHGIDFEDAIEVFEYANYTAPSYRSNEQRFITVGWMQGREIAVIYTIRSQTARIISARRARSNERKALHETTRGRSPEG